MPTIRISRAFEREQDLVDLINTLGGAQNEIDRIIADGFISMKDLVIHHEHDLEMFRTYLKTLIRPSAGIRTQLRSCTSHQC